VVFVTPQPGVSRFGLEFLRRLQEDLAMVAAARGTAAELRERADRIESGAAAAEAVIVDRLAAAIAAMGPSEIPTGRAPRRPRLEEAGREDRERAARARATVLLHPNLSVREVARRCKVSRGVVTRIREELEVAEKVAEKPPVSHEVAEKPSARRRRP
jgi:DNA invertase Pin-like site-specific DNA recombinase